MPVLLVSTQPHPYILKAVLATVHLYLSSSAGLAHIRHIMIFVE